jgi:hypothetical protein
VDRGISQALGFLSRGWGDLYAGARVWARLRPGGSRHSCRDVWQHRGGAARLELRGYSWEANTGGAAVSLPCCGAGTGEVRARPVTQAGQRGAGEWGKGAVVRRLVARRGERSGGVVGRGERRKGKLTSRPACQLPWRKVKGCDAVRPVGWAGPRPAGYVSRGKKRRREAGLGWAAAQVDLGS